MHLSAQLWQAAWHHIHTAQCALLVQALVWTNCKGSTIIVTGLNGQKVNNSIPCFGRKPQGLLSWRPKIQTLCLRSSSTLASFILWSFSWEVYSRAQLRSGSLVNNFFSSTQPDSPVTQLHAIPAGPDAATIEKKWAPASSLPRWGS